MPVDVLGNSQNTTCFGTLKLARVSLQKSIRSFSLTGLSLTISINAQGTSPHLSSGFATTAAEFGAEERNIMAMTGHKTTQMVRRYIQEANLFKNNALNKIKI